MKTYMQIVVLMMMVFSIPLAQAHTKLVSSFPEKGSVLAESPEKLSLAFKKRLILVKVELKKDKKQTIAIDFKPKSKRKASYALDLPKLETGKYSVKWVAISKDGHKISGHFSFLIK